MAVAMARGRGDAPSPKGSGGLRPPIPARGGGGVPGLGCPRAALMPPTLALGCLSLVRVDFDPSPRRRAQPARVNWW